MPIQSPPEPLNTDGKPRRVGVELEFAGLLPEETAEIAQSLFGGTIEPLSAHRIKLRDTRWGDFNIELDSRYVHPESQPDVPNDSEWQRLRLKLDRRYRELLGDVVTGVVPTEIVCPPIDWERLDELDILFNELRRYGAKGTDASLLYGFGLHLNPELPALDSATILRYLRAWLLCANGIREQIRVDITREVLPHANPFPQKYCLKVLDQAYRPDLETLVNDYLSDNDTRNRDLDLLPLFAHLCPNHSHPLLRKGLVQARPTFHYRLPNAQLSDPEWGVVREWNRWLEVETLACTPDTLAERMAEYRARHARSGWWQKLRSLLPGGRY
ncbi:amidoligase family protein [Halomonas cupida]|uniref:amidoligase family protein n=1 Tax=Halomonas cupida TaxID=44933 RepID=UPI003A8F483A